jgi:hypothetical protein
MRFSFRRFLSTFCHLLVSPKNILGYKRAIASVAPNIAQVYRHVPSERILARQNLVADITDRVAQVDLIVVTSDSPSFERLVAPAANVTPI